MSLVKSMNFELRELPINFHRILLNNLDNYFDICFGDYYLNLQLCLPTTFIRDVSSVNQFLEERSD